MTLQYKILASNAAFTLVVTLVLAFITDTFPGNGFFAMFGLVDIVVGLSCLGLGLMWLLRKDKRFSGGYLTSSVILLLVGLVCFMYTGQY